MREKKVKIGLLRNLLKTVERPQKKKKKKKRNGQTAVLYDGRLKLKKSWPGNDLLQGRKADAKIKTRGWVRKTVQGGDNKNSIALRRIRQGPVGTVKGGDLMFAQGPKNLTESPNPFKKTA